MTWEIVLGIIALVGFVGTIVSWSNKLSQTIATLEAAIIELRKTIEGLRAEEKEMHDILEERIADHEIRIRKIELGEYPPH